MRTHRPFQVLCCAIALVFSGVCARAAASFSAEIYRNAAFTGPGTSDILTMTGSVTPGQWVHVAVVSEANSKNVSSMVGLNGESGTFRGKVHALSVHNCEMWDFYVTTPWAAGGTMTVNWSSAEDTSRGYIIFTSSGLAAAGQPDVSPVQTTATFGSTVDTSITTTSDGDLLVGVIVVQGNKAYALGNGTQVNSQLLVGHNPPSTQGLLGTVFYNVQSTHGTFSAAGTETPDDTALVVYVAYKKAPQRFRYVDLASGSDAAAGTSTSTPWLHGPGDTNATGNASAFTAQEGDTIFFKGGTTGSFDIALKQSGAAANPITYDGTGHDETGATWGTGRAINDLNNVYYHAFNSNPGKNYITLKGFKILHAKNNNNAASVMINRAESDQVVTYGGDGDIYNEGGIFDLGGIGWVLDGLDLSEFENCYDRAVLNAENDTDMPFVTPQEIPCTKAGIEMYQGAHGFTITNCTLWAIGRTAIKIFGCTNFMVTDCNIGGADGMTNSGWFAVAVKMSGVGSWGCGPGIVRRLREHDGWQYQGDESQQRCHAGDWNHWFGDNDGTLEANADVHDIDMFGCFLYSNHTFSFHNGTSYFFFESDGYNIRLWDNLLVNSFSGGIETRDFENLEVYNNTFIDNGGEVPITLKTASHFYPTNVVIKNNVLYTTTANSANTPFGTSNVYLGAYPTSDYNRFNMPNGGNKPVFWNGTSFATVGAWNAASGQDAHSTYGAINLVNIPSAASSSSGDYSPASGSALIDAGITIALFNTDINGLSRPQGSAWDIGAIESTASGGGSAIQRWALKQRAFLQGNAKLP